MKHTKKNTSNINMLLISCNQIAVNAIVVGGSLEAWFTYVKCRKHGSEALPLSSKLRLPGFAVCYGVCTACVRRVYGVCTATKSTL